MSKISTLFEQAKAAKEHAYAPYSKFKVGAAILDENGKIHIGCNVENVSYPCGTCAEAGAIAAMIVAGAKEIHEILVMADSSTIIYPCGACLQRIAQFCIPSTIVHLADSSKIHKSVPFSTLMPCAFDEKELKHD